MLCLAVKKGVRGGNMVSPAIRRGARGGKHRFPPRAGWLSWPAMRTRRTWLVLAAVAVAAAVAIGVVALTLRGGEDSASNEDYELTVVNTRDRTDFALGQLSRAQSLEELLERMDETAAAVESAAGDLEGAGVPDGFEDETERLVEQLRMLAADVQGTADQARVPGFEDILVGAAGLDFESWDKINAILAELRKQGIDVQPLARKTTS